MLQGTKTFAKKVLRRLEDSRSADPPSPFWRGFHTWQSYSAWPAYEPQSPAKPSNALRDFFNARKTGRGIWKADHYFDIYERHLRRFRNTEVSILEIGVYSGGSLEMWRDYFGPRSRIIGIDIEPRCRAYETEFVRIFTGSQNDRGFWRRFKAEVPKVDIVIDDCSHVAEDQIVSFEELLPHLQPGGVYLCEDIIRTSNVFASYLYGFADNLYSHDERQDNAEDNERRNVSPATAFQSAIDSVHFYPNVAVVEKTVSPVAEFVQSKHGTEWQPFLK